MPHSESEFKDYRSLISYLDDLRKSLGKPDFDDDIRKNILGSTSSALDAWFTHPKKGERLMEEKILAAKSRLLESNVPVTPETVSRQACFELYYSLQQDSLKYYLDHKQEAGSSEFTAGMYDILYGFNITLSGLHKAEATGKGISLVREILGSMNPDKFGSLGLKPYQDAKLVASGLKLGLHTYDRVNTIANRVMFSGS